MTFVRTLARATLVLAFAAPIVGAIPAEPAQAAAPPSGGFLPTDGVSGLDPERDTPINSPIWAMDAADGILYVGGPFTRVMDRQSWTSSEHAYLAAFDQGTGESLSWFRTQPDGPVYDLLTLPEGQILIGGEFTTVNGRADTAGLAIVDAKTGAADTGFRVALDPYANGTAKVNSVAVTADWIYLGGSFSGLTGGPNHTHMTAFRVARVNRHTGEPDPSWKPVASGGGVWGIAVSPDGNRIHIGGRFTSMNFDPEASLLATVNASDGQLTSGWNHGLPHAQPYPGFVYDVDVAPGGQLIVAGKPHFYAIMDSATGAVIRDVSTPADAQTIDIDGDSIIIGCHCHKDQSWMRQLDAITLNEVWRSSDLSGRAGVFAASTRPDGCVYGGGELTRGTTASGSSTTAFGLVLYCPVGTEGTSQATAQRPPVSDSQAPSRPGKPQIVGTIASSARISWSPSVDDHGDVTYLVLRNGAPVGSTGGTSYFDAELGHNSSYDWQVVAVDLAGNPSEASPVSPRLRVGARTNVARGRTVSQSTTREFYSADRAVDGNTSGSFAVGSLAVTERGDRHAEGSWWQIDLGSVVGVSEVRVYPHTDVGGGTAHLNWQMKGYYSNSPIPEPNHFAANLGGYGSIRGPKAPPQGTTRIEVFSINESFRYLKIFAGESTALEIAEVEVFTVPTSIDPVARPTDATPPAAPTWVRASPSGAGTRATFGGAADSVGVVYHEVYRGSTLLATSQTNDAWLDLPGLRGRDLTVVAYDAAGNHSANLPTDPEPNTASCLFVRDGGSVTVTWDDIGTVDRLVVERSVGQGPFWWRGKEDDLSTTDFIDSDRIGQPVSYRIRTRTATTWSDPVPCSEEEPPPPPTPVTCSLSRDGTSAVVSWTGAPWPSVTVHRSVDGGNPWWRGRVDTSGDGSFPDSDLAGRSLIYQIRPPYGYSGEPVTCEG